MDYITKTGDSVYMMKVPLCFWFTLFNYYHHLILCGVVGVTTQCTTHFLEDFLALSGFLSSVGSNFIICCDISVHLNVECGDRSRFNDILQCCSLV